MDSITHRISMSLSLSSYADHGPELLKKLNAMHGHPDGVPLDQKAPPALLFAHYAIRQYKELKLEATIARDAEITYRVVSPTTATEGVEKALLERELELEQIRESVQASACEGTLSAVERRLHQLCSYQKDTNEAYCVVDRLRAQLLEVRAAVGAKDGEQTLEAVQRRIEEVRDGR